MTQIKRLNLRYALICFSLLFVATSFSSEAISACSMSCLHTATKCSKSCENKAHKCQIDVINKYKKVAKETGYKISAATNSKKAMRGCISTRKSCITSCQPVCGSCDARFDACVKKGKENRSWGTVRGGSLLEIQFNCDKERTACKACTAN